MFRQHRIPGPVVLVVLTVGIFLGIVISARFELNNPVIAEEKKTSSKAALLESAFVEVADRVGRAVVSISTEQTEEIRGYRLYPRFHDDFIDRFFREFFGEIPDEGRTFRRKHRGLGSGVIIDEAGYILTNHHVVENVDKITVSLSDGRKLAGVMKGYDPRYDLAVIKINARNLKAAELGDSDHVRAGQWAIALGNPFAFLLKEKSPAPSVSVGVISALHRSISARGHEREYSDLIQTDAAINPGNSGGPLVNLEGEVIGINVAIISSTGAFHGIGFAIPINTARAIIDRLIEGKKALYGYLGVVIQNLDEDLAEAFGLPDQDGAVVTSVQAGTPAEKAGFKSGDVIRTFDGEKIRSMRELLRKVGLAEVGKKIKLGIFRNRKEMVLEAEIGERPEQIEEFARAAAGAWRGLEVQQITPEIARRFEIIEREGVVVTNVEPGSPAEDAGISVGDVIDEINQKRIGDLSDYQKVIKGVRGNVLLRTIRGDVVGYVVINPE